MTQETQDTYAYLFDDEAYRFEWSNLENGFVPAPRLDAGGVTSDEAASGAIQDISRESLLAFRSSPEAQNVAPTVALSPNGGALALTGQIAIGNGGPNQIEVLGLPNGNFAVARAGSAGVTIDVLSPSGALLSETVVFRNGTGLNQPGLALLSNGDFVATWDIANDTGLYMAQFDQNGTQLRPTQSGWANFASNRAPEVVALSGGNYVVTWQGLLGDLNIYARIFASNGDAISDTLEVNSAVAANQIGPEIMALSNGGFVITWQDRSLGVGGTGGDTSDYAVKAQIYNANGTRLGGELLVNVNTAGDQTVPQVVALANGGFVTVWMDGSTAAGFSAKGRMFAADGTPLTSEFMLNAPGGAPQTTAMLPEVAALQGGGFVAAWEGRDVSAQIFSASGARVGGEILVDSDGRRPDIVVLSTGNFVIGWTDPQGPRAQMFDASGNLVGGATILNSGTLSNPTTAIELAALQDGKFGASWVNSGVHYARTYDDIVSYRAIVSAPLNLKGTIAVGDADAGSGLLTATLSVTAGALAVDAGATGAIAVGSGTASVVVNGTLAQINALLGTGGGVVAYTATAAGTATFNVSLNDNGNSGGGALIASASAQIGADVDALPVVTLSHPSVVYNEPSFGTYSTVFVDSAITITDSDSLTLASATVRISGNYVPGEDGLVLAGQHGNITYAFNASTGVLVMQSANATATVAQWQTALRNVLYTNNSDEPTTANRTIEIVVNDSLVNSVVVTEQIIIQSTNDNPLIDLNTSRLGTGAVLNYGPAGSELAIAALGTISDRDSSNFGGGNLTVAYGSGSSVSATLLVHNSGLGAGQIGLTGNVVTYGGVAIGTTSGGTNGTNLTIALNDFATATATTALLKSIAYKNSVTGPNVSLNVTVNDGDGANSTSLTAVANITGGTALRAPVNWLSQAGASTSAWFTGDFNGDGKTDAFRYAPGVSGAEMKLSSGSSLVASGSWTGAGYGVDNRWYVGDFNGDGKDDVFRYLDVVSGADMFLSTGSSFAGQGSWLNVGYGSSQRWYVGDFNGDGKDDVFRYLEGTSGADMFLSTGTAFSGAGSWTGAGIGLDGTWYVGDFNGDGKDDIFRYLPGTSGADMFLSTGSSFAHVGSWTGAGFGTDGKWYVGDFNGDGRDDIMRYLEGQSGAQVFHSTGDSFGTPVSYTGAGTGVGGWYSGDFTGDGRADLMRILPNDTIDVLGSPVV